MSDQFYLPSKPRVDERAARLVTGASWLFNYAELEVNPATGMVVVVNKDEAWSVVAASEMVTVPAGTFTTHHLHKDTSGAASKDYWFAAGVGKVKETGEQLEELTSYDVPRP